MPTDPMWVFENYGAAAELIDELEQERDQANATIAELRAEVERLRPLAEDRDQQYDMKVKAREQRDKLRAELDALRGHMSEARDAADAWWKNCEELHNDYATPRWLALLLAAPIAKEQGEWIACAERLPEPFTVVSLLDENRWMNTGDIDFEVNWTGAGWLNDSFAHAYWSAIGESRGLTLDSVTHWRQLPAAPSRQAES